MQSTLSRLLYVSAILLIPLQSGAQCSVCFGAATSYATGSNPYGVSSADFNGDGFQDLAVANWGSSTVSVLLNTGSGTFGAASNFAVGTNPRAIVTGDFNNDGFRDFATCNDGTVNVSVRLGNGSGGFGAVTNYGVAAAPESILKADFNGDGNTDLATANYGSQNVSILLGTGSGTFGAATNYSTGASSFPYGSCTADFNLDTRADIVTVSYSSSNLARMHGNGTGGMGAAASFATGSTGAYSVCSADFNGDNNPDLAIANANTNNISRLNGNGSGGFAAATTYAAGTFPFCVIPGDFNMDAKADVAVANYSSNNVSVLIGLGTGSFCAAVNYGVGTSPTSVCTADFNNDGKPDLALSNNNSNNVSVLLNCTTVLPVELLSFECKGESREEVKLEWTAVAAPDDYANFRIERSIDGKFFEPAGYVSGNSGTGNVEKYSFTDHHPASDRLFYRLILTEKNGLEKIMETTTCLPVQMEPAQVNVRSITGQLLFSYSSSDSEFQIGSWGLSPGVYLIERIRNGERSYSKHLIGQ